MTIQTLKKHIIPTLKNNGAVKIAVFGSFANGSEKKSSDVDILVKFKKEITLMDLSGMKIKLEDKIGRKVDLITYEGINPRIKKIILNEQKIIYEKRSSEA